MGRIGPSDKSGVDHPNPRFSFKIEEPEDMLEPAHGVISPLPAGTAAPPKQTATDANFCTNGGIKGRKDVPEDDSSLLLFNHHKQGDKMKKIIVIVGAILTLASGFAMGHGGGLDKNGCHTNHKTGEYHCHR